MRRKVINFLCIATLLACVFSFGEMGYAASSDSGFLDLIDILRYPGKYHNASYNIGSTNSTVKLGLNFEKLNDNLKNINYPVKDTNYNKVHITSLKLKKVTLDAIYFSTEVRVRRYEKFLLGTMFTRLDKTASFEFKLDYYFDSKDNSLVFKKVKASNISLEQKNLDYIFTDAGVDVQSIAEVIEENININIPCDGKIRLNLLYHEYFKISQLYTQGNFLYMNFTTNNKKAVEDFIKVCKGLGIAITNSTPSPSPTPNSNVVKIPKERLIMEVPTTNESLKK